MAVGGRMPDGRGRSGRQQYRPFAEFFKRGVALAATLYRIAGFPIMRRSRMVRPKRTLALAPDMPGAALTASRVAFACLALGLVGATPANAQGLDGTWRGTTSGMPSGGNCRSFTFTITIRGTAVSGGASTPHSGSPVSWAVSGAVSGQRVVLLVESSDRRLRNPSTRWRGELRDGALHLEQIGSQSCNPTRAGDLKRS